MGDASRYQNDIVRLFNMGMTPEEVSYALDLSLLTVREQYRLAALEDMPKVPDSEERDKLTCVINKLRKTVPAELAWELFVSGGGSIDAFTQKVDELTRYRVGDYKDGHIHIYKNDSVSVTIFDQDQNRAEFSAQRIAIVLNH